LVLHCPDDGGLRPDVFVVDLGRAQLVKTEMRRAADAAARAAAAEILNGTDAARSQAVRFAALNLSDGTPTPVESPRGRRLRLLRDPADLSIHPTMTATTTSMSMIRRSRRDARFTQLADDDERINAVSVTAHRATARATPFQLCSRKLSGCNPSMCTPTPSLCSIRALPATASPDQEAQALQERHDR